jgi:inorganic pyrophosphatase
VPVKKLHPYYDEVKRYSDLPDTQIEQITHFFAHYKDLERDKWVKIVRWGDETEAAHYIREGIARAQEKTQGVPGLII